MHSKKACAISVSTKELNNLLQAVKAMHDRHISHTDLKPGNIIISMHHPGLSGLEATVTDLGGAILNNQCKSYQFTLRQHSCLTGDSPLCLAEWGY